MPTPEYAGNTAILHEAQDSPKWELGEKATATATYKGLYSVCLASALPRGTFGTGTFDGFRVASCTVQRSRGSGGSLVITWEANASTSGQSLPQDEVDVQPFEINPKLEKNKYFVDLTDDQLDRVRAAFNAQSVEARLSAMQSGDPAIAYHLLTKLRRGIENYYLAGFDYKWTFQSWTAPALNAGGYIESPGGPLSGVMPDTYSFIRLADGIQFTGQYYKVTRTWKGAPTAGGTSYWDPDLYT
jgi:hypothetical protein